MTESSASTNLWVTPQECTALAALIDQELGEVHEELRRTENFEFHDKLREREQMLHALKDKFAQVALA